MRLSQYLFETFRHTAESGPGAAGLLHRAGYLRGRRDWLPLGQHLRRQLLGQLTSGLHSFAAAEADLDLPAGEHARLTHLAATLSGMLRSHRQLPRTVWQARSGVFEAFSFGQAASADAFGDLALRLSEAGNTGLLRVAAGPGRTVLLHPAGTGGTEFVSCDACGTSQTTETAVFRRDVPPPAVPLPPEEVATPGTATIADLAAFLGIPATATAKAVFLKERASGDGRLILAVLRGDLQLSETKLAHALGSDGFRPATEAEIRAAGAEPGYGSPLGLDPARVLVVADESVAHAVNLVAGANRPGRHVLNTNVPRDYEPELLTDIALPGPDARCADCGGSLRSSAGTEIARIFAVPDGQSRAAGLTYRDGDNDELPVAVTMFTFGIDAFLLAVALENHDAAGLAWPQGLTPFGVILLPLGKPGSAELEEAERLHAELEAAGVRVLLDDRDARPGVKFNDADLLGIPLRFTIGGRGLEAGELEGRWRRSGEDVKVPLRGAAAEITRLLQG